MKLASVLLFMSCQCSALEVHEALSAATGWPAPGRHGSDDGPKKPPEKPDCPPVPVPGAFWLFGSAVVGLVVVRRHG